MEELLNKAVALEIQRIEIERKMGDLEIQVIELSDIAIGDEVTVNEKHAEFGYEGGLDVYGIYIDFIDDRKGIITPVVRYVMSGKGSRYLLTSATRDQIEKA